MPGVLRTPAGIPTICVFALLLIVFGWRSRLYTHRKIVNQILK
jgi:hypothetical protein